MNIEKIVEKTDVTVSMEPAVVEHLTNLTNERPYPVVWSLDDQWEGQMEQQGSERPFPVVWNLDDQWDKSIN